MNKSSHIKHCMLLLFFGLTTNGSLLASPDPLLKCYARLGKGNEPTGMTVEYSALESKATVSFVKQHNSANLNHGQCTLSNLEWNNDNITGHFCHFNVNDVIYKRNINSMNFISEKAPYLIKILKNGGEFSLKVRRDNNLCPGGLVVNQVLP